MTEFTKSQINALGERLRKSKPVSSDLEKLDAYRRSFDDAYGSVVQTMGDLGLQPSGRIKTTLSIVEKLKRQSFRLSKLQDIAGCRIIVEDLAGQKGAVALISKALPNAKTMDRRETQSHGYRAVHIVAEVLGRFVEIQVRTELQHLWAVWSEALADKYGQSIKYGRGPAEIQRTLYLQSKLFRLLEEKESIIEKGLNLLGEKKLTFRLADLRSLGDLPEEVAEAMRLHRGLIDLIKQKETEKDQLKHEILLLKQGRKDSGFSD